MDTAAAERHLARARAHYARGDARACGREIDAGLTCAGDDPTPVRTRLLLERAKLVAFSGDGELSMDAAMVAAGSARATGTEIALAELSLARAHYLAGSNLCFRHARRARRAARQAGDDEQYLEATSLIAAAQQAAGNARRGIGVAHALLAVAERGGRKIWIETARWHLARMKLLAEGHPDSVAAELKALVRARGLGLNRSHVRADLALALADAGDVEESRTLLRVLERTTQTGWDRAVAAFYRSEVEWASGNPARALAAAEEGLEVARWTTELAIRSTRLWSLFELGRMETDDRMLGPLPAAGRMMAYCDPEARAFGALAAGDHAAAEQWFVAAAAAARGNVKREEVRALWGAGEAAMQGGSTERARELLTDAESRAVEAGLLSMLPRIRRSLRALESRPRGRERLRDLTPRERAVLRRVAAGRASNEIADALGIAPSTVETHIRSAMAKLGARTRLHAVHLAGAEVAADGRFDEQERAILELIAEGATVTEAADLLGISRSTATRRLRRARQATRTS